MEQDIEQVVDTDIQLLEVIYWQRIDLVFISIICSDDNHWIMTELHSSEVWLSGSGREIQNQYY